MGKFYAMPNMAQVADMQRLIEQSVFDEKKGPMRSQSATLATKLYY